MGKDVPTVSGRMPFSDVYSCLACGFTRGSTMQPLQRACVGDECAKEYGPGLHLHVTCVNCKFEWQMDARNAILVPEEKPETPSAYDPGA